MTKIFRSRNGAMASLLAATFLLSSCQKEKDDPATPTPPVNEEELITDVIVIFTDGAGNELEWHAHAEGGIPHDHDHEHEEGEHGDGDVHIHGDDLAANTVYGVRIILLNRSVTPTDTVSNEVAGEAEAHQFFFIPEDVDITTAYNDADADGNPLGLLSTWTVGAAGTGELKLILRHEPNKFAAGVSSGDITNAGGATDVEIHFPAVIL